MRHPFIQNTSSIITYLIAWLLITLNHIMVLNLLLNVRFDYAVFDAIVHNVLFMILGLSLWYPSIYLSIDKNKILKTISNHVAGGIITTIIWVYSGYFILSQTIDDKNYLSFLNNAVYWRGNIGLMFYLVTVVFYYVAYYYKGFKEKAQNEAELKSLVKEAELKTLKYQINPHFIFNSLNSISSLTITNPDKAREMTIKLSSFMRKTLSGNESQMTRLKDEVDNSRLYMEIEKIRFEDKLEYVEFFDEDCRKINVPNMILQPLFENAIKHGVYESTEKITISFACKKENGYLKISLQNNFDPEGVSRKGEGIGLKNIKNRLKLIYNEDNLLTSDKLENLFTVNIYIPCE